MHIIFCSDPLNRSAVDPVWQHEYEQATKLDIPTHLFSYEELLESNVKNALKGIFKHTEVAKIIYRGWMMPVDMYESLYKGLQDLNFELFNSPAQYKHCFYMPESYEIIRNHTPKSFFMDQLPPLDKNKIIALLSNFGSEPIIVKDFVKSQKHHWHEACYIPDPSDTEQALQVINKFVELQGDNFQGGIVLREFVELEPLGLHSKSKMPLTEEYRLFILHGRLIGTNNYWEEKDYSSEEIPVHQFETLYSAVESNFYTIDIAKLKGGEWIIIELGDAQVAEYIGEDGMENFYREIAKITNISSMM